MSEPARGQGTRARIQAVAIDLFTEQGYDKTSLREIAERLDVTKAALYYHFKSKEDIVASLIEDYAAQLDELIAWGQELPRTAPAREEILRRYIAIVSRGHKAFRMLHQNQAMVHSMATAQGRGDVFRERLSQLIELLTAPDATLADRLRPAMALGGIGVGWMFFADQVADRGELCSAVLEIACDLAGVPRSAAARTSGSTR